MEQYKLDRRHFLKGAALVGAGAALASLAGCGEDEEKPSEENTDDTGTATTDAGAAKTADRIVIGVPTDADDLDPVTCTGNQNIFLFNLIVEGLVMTSDDGKEIEPCLATGWDVSEDGTVYTFHVMEGLKFSDGTPVTAEDWQWTFDRALNSPDSSWYMCVENIDHVECPDDTTVIIYTKQAAASQLANLSTFMIGVQSKKYFEKVGEEKYHDGPLSTGPYMITEWKKGEYLTFQANPYYRTEGLPKTKEVEFKVVAEDAARKIQLQSGDIDIADAMPFSDLKELENDKNCVPHPDPSTMVYWVSLNVQNKYLSDPEVRKALFLATDAQEIVDAVSYGYATPAGTIVNPSSEYCNTALKPPVADPEQAKKVLADAGYKDGEVSVKLLLRGGNATYEQIATWLQSQWKKAGVNLEIDSRETTAYKEARDNLDLDVVISGWSDDVPDPTNLMQFVFDYHVTFGYYSGFEQPEDMQELNREATVELDIAKRQELYNEIQQGFADQGIFIPLMCLPWQNATRKNIEGFVQTPLGNYRFENLIKNV